MPTPEPDPECQHQPSEKICLSALLLHFADQYPTAEVKFIDIANLLGKRSFGFLLLLLALPNSLPMIGIPGFSALTGIPMLFFALQMAVGFHRPYLPLRLQERTFSRRGLVHLTRTIAPWLSKVEQIMQPRLHFLTTHTAERLLGCLCILLSILLIMPIPFGNLLPASAVLFIALGLIERDGFLVLFGAVVGVFSVYILSSVLWAFTETVIHFFQQFID